METNYERFCEYVDSCKEIEELQSYRKSNSELFLRNEFWKLRETVFTTHDSLEKEKALAKIQWIKQFFGCDIPNTKNVNQFKAPHGLYGIYVSSRACIGKGCTIFQQVTIGSNMLMDSKNSGFPIIGEDVFIGAGAKIIGNVIIGDHSRIGANCCVTQDVPPNSVVVSAKNRIIEKGKTLNNVFLTPNRYLAKKWAQGVEYDATDIEQNLLIDKAIPSDIYEILRLYQERVNWLKWKGYKQWNHYLQTHTKEEFLQKIKDGKYYVVRKEKEIIGGFVIDDQCEFWVNAKGKAKYLTSVVTKVGYRNVGKVIVDAAKKITLESGNDFLRMECVFANEKLNEIWYYHGFLFVKDVEGRYHCSLRQWDGRKKKSGELHNEG